MLFFPSVAKGEEKMHRFLRYAAACWLVIACASLSAGAPAQHKSVSKTDKANANTDVSQSADIPQQGGAQIDLEISEMLGAWQVGDTGKLHSHYSEDVTVVSGEYEPPLAGWSSYLAAYERQRQRVASVRLDRRNTYVRVEGNVAWASYQWDFAAIVDGKPSAARGQTTLILERRGDHWLIVHNHTSQICPPDAPAPATPPASGPAPAPVNPG
jgi:ketosteroid isomerase-like protein